MPKRLQLQRTKGYRKPPNSTKVARPTKWGNPFQDMEQSIAAEKFDYYFKNPGKCADPETEAKLAWMRENIGSLAGKDLVCWCVEGTPCHGDTLLEAANRDDVAARMIAEVVKETVPGVAVKPKDDAADAGCPFVVKWEIKSFGGGVVSNATMSREFKSETKAKAYCAALIERGDNARVETNE